jgi:hypothetical protein
MIKTETRGAYGARTLFAALDRRDNSFWTNGSTCDPYRLVAASRTARPRPGGGVPQTSPYIRGCKPIFLIGLTRCFRGA